ncbi:MAG: hypothetical protein RQ826_17655, partial [Xanthomonadales bacterium]|nr:hypothetical protein [Xanthomonadales bacterium]
RNALFVKMKSQFSVRLGELCGLGLVHFSIGFLPWKHGCSRVREKNTVSTTLDSTPVAQFGTRPASPVL